MHGITLKGVTKVFAEGPAALDVVDLSVARGELLLLTGESGAGKTTLLRIIAGLETPTSGEVYFNDLPMNGVKPEKRNVAMVFQTPALFPHMTSAQNIAFGLQLRGAGRAEAIERVLEMAGWLEITGVLQRKPFELSGGQAQRVALGRALIRRPEVLLLDEPFSNLDFELAARLRDLVLSMHQRLGTTIIWSTHLRPDLTRIPARIAVLRSGRLEKTGTLQQLREQNSSAFVSQIIG